MAVNHADKGVSIVNNKVTVTKVGGQEKQTGKFQVSSIMSPLQLTPSTAERRGPMRCTAVHTFKLYA